jgi:hypothetical protein
MPAFVVLARPSKYFDSRMKPVTRLRYYSFGGWWDFEHAYLGVGADLLRGRDAVLCPNRPEIRTACARPLRGRFRA